MCIVLTRCVKMNDKITRVEIVHYMKENLEFMRRL